jgi:competence protein ComEA
VESFLQKYFPLIKQYLIPIVLGFVGISLIGYGLIYSLVTKSDSREITFSSTEQQTKTEKKSPLKEVLIDVEGAVLKPGIHKLPLESRIQDALLAAGGMSEKADHQQVAKVMNLAAKVIDGGKIYIPFKGETIDASGGQIGKSAEQNLLGAQTGGVININNATEKDLDTLSGVGPATAQKIIAGRPYSSVEELLSKKMVGKSVFEKIKDKVTVN